jgi:tRNA A-37 threonylcarbamoyl transferase component Bud32/membrane-associated phospholipid phosphatase
MAGRRTSGPRPSPGGGRDRQTATTVQRLDLPGSDPSVTIADQTPPSRVVRRVPRRRPSGAPPPLPRHLRRTGVGWLIAAAAAVVVTVLVLGGGVSGAAIPLLVVDDTVVRWVSDVNLPGIDGVARALNAAASWWVIQIANWVLIVALIIFRRWRLLVIALVATQVAVLVNTFVEKATTQPRPFGVSLQASWGGWSMPSFQVLALTGFAVIALYTLVPEGRLRNRAKWIVAALLTLVALARLHLGVDSPSDIIIAVLISVSLGVTAFRVFAPSEAFPVTYKRGRTAHLDVGGARGEAIRRAARDQLGLTVSDLQPVGLSGSAGSTPLRLRVEGASPPYLFGKLYSRTHLRSDRWYKLGRELLYGRLEDEKPFNTVRRLVQQEDYALRVFRDAGVPGPKPYGFVELTPEREYVLITEFLDDAVELGDAEVDDALIDEALHLIRVLWDNGLAHRDIKPANLMVRDGHIVVIDVAFAELRPTPWRQAVDLANMMLCLALRSSAHQVYDRARLQFSVEEISEAFAAARGLALPSQLRRALSADARDVHGEFLRLLPERPRPIKIQRWTVRRLAAALTVAIVVVALVLNGARLFSNDNTRTPVYVAARCDDMEAMWLQAQAVQSAQLVPCVAPLPIGWSFRELTVNNGRSTMTVDHDRAGARALELRFAESCDTSGATQVAPDVPGARRYERRPVEGNDTILTWYEVFDGGCATAQLTSSTNASEVVDEVTAQSDRVIRFLTRAELAQVLDERSDGRLQLDPPS